MRPSRLLPLLAALLVPGSMRAHDPSESWTEAIVHPAQLELLVTMAQSNALRLIDPANKIPQLTPENFPQHRARLLALGATLFTLTSLKSRVAARQVAVELTEESDIAFTITYPRPAAGLLILDAAFLKKLGEGFGGVIDASDTEGHHLGWDQISWENTSLVVMVPAPGMPPKKSSAVIQPALAARPPAG
jgi:hypothetical protein